MQADEDDLGDDLRTLDLEQRRELKDSVSFLERTLKSSTASIDLVRLLPSPSAGHRRAVLHELIKKEIELRYALGQRCLLDDFLRRYPELGGPEQLPVSLLYEEFRIRRQCGERPGLDEYRERFPNQFDRFRSLAERQALLAPGGLAVLPKGRKSTLVDATPPRVVEAPPPRNAGSHVGPVHLQPLVGYEKLELLGRGEFGEVWRALAPGGVEVALKFVLRALDHQSTRRELNSLEKIKRTHHPFLLQTHSFGMLDGKLTIVMELADRSLSDRFEQCKEQGLKAIPPEELVTYFGQAAEALDYLQSQHISHRDIKPQNLLSLQGFAKVADFGLARGQDEKIQDASVVCGTAHYMAPEAWGQRVSVFSDQYSLACTYVHMRLGHPLFEGNFHEVLIHHIESEPPLDPLSPDEQAVLKRALAKDPDRRFPTCAAFALALKEATAPPPPPPPKTRSRLGLKTAIALMVLAPVLSILLAAFLMPRNSPPAPPPPPEPKIDWQPKDWEPEGPDDIVVDMNNRRYYRRLVRDVGGQKVVMVVVPRLAFEHPETFYIMENKVWNDLYAEFYPHRADLFKKYSSGQGCEKLVSDDSLEPAWRKGAFAYNLNPKPNAPPYFGVDGFTIDGQRKGRLPVFRVLATEAYCFAKWLDPVNGSLPTCKQWCKAAGLGEDNRNGPFNGDVDDSAELAIKLMSGPWPVEKGDRDVSKYGCRQMASNGREWTRDLEPQDVIPLQEMLGPRRVYYLGQPYDAARPLTFEAMATPRSNNIDERNEDYFMSFRVVLQEK